MPCLVREGVRCDLNRPRPVWVCLFCCSVLYRYVRAAPEPPPRRKKVTSIHFSPRLFCKARPDVFTREVRGSEPAARHAAARERYVRAGPVRCLVRERRHRPLLRRDEGGLREGGPRALPERYDGRAVGSGRRRARSSVLLLCARCHPTIQRASRTSSRVDNRRMFECARLCLLDHGNAALAAATAGVAAATSPSAHATFAALAALTTAAAARARSTWHTRLPRGSARRRMPQRRPRRHRPLGRVRGRCPGGWVASRRGHCHTSGARVSVAVLCRPRDGRALVQSGRQQSGRLLVSTRMHLCGHSCAALASAALATATFAATTLAASAATTTITAARIPSSFPTSLATAVAARSSSVATHGRRRRGVLCRHPHLWPAQGPPPRRTMGHCLATPRAGKQTKHMGGAAHPGDSHELNDWPRAGRSPHANPCAHERHKASQAGPNK